jgi:hypothetical protein
MEEIVLFGLNLGCHKGDSHEASYLKPYAHEH